MERLNLVSLYLFMYNWNTAVHYLYFHGGFVCRITCILLSTEYLSVWTMNVTLLNMNPDRAMDLLSLSQVCFCHNVNIGNRHSENYADTLKTTIIYKALRLIKKTFFLWQDRLRIQGIISVNKSINSIFFIYRLLV